jgi:hypothetical protein
VAITILPQPISPNLPPASRIRMFAFTFTGSYAAPGEVLTATNLGMTLFYSVQLTGSPIAYMPIMVPTTPAAQDGSFSTFSVGWVDMTPAGACVQVANGAYPGAITGGFVYAYVHGR